MLAARLDSSSIRLFPNDLCLHRQHCGHTLNHSQRQTAELIMGIQNFSERGHVASIQRSTRSSKASVHPMLSKILWWSLMPCFLFIFECSPFRLKLINFKGLPCGVV